MLLKWFILFLVGIILFILIGYLTGNAEYGGAETKDDERMQRIKQKSIVSSWLLLLSFFVFNFIFDLLNLTDERLALIPFPHPELFYLLVAIVSYVFFFWKYHRQMSSHEK